MRRDFNIIRYDFLCNERHDSGIWDMICELEGILLEGLKYDLMLNEMWF